MNKIKISMETITEKLERLERYIRRLNFQVGSPKKNLIFHFHNIFQEEMEDTESGKKWRSKLELSKNISKQNSQQTGVSMNGGGSSGN